MEHTRESFTFRTGWTREGACGYLLTWRLLRWGVYPVSRSFKLFWTDLPGTASKRPSAMLFAWTAFSARRRERRKQIDGESSLHSLFNDGRSSKTEPRVLEEGESGGIVFQPKDEEFGVDGRRDPVFSSDADGLFLWLK